MWTLPYSLPQKAGVVLYGLVVGACVVPITALGCLLLGFCVGAFEHFAGIHGEGAWVLVASFYYGLYLGVPVGLVVS